MPQNEYHPRLAKQLSDLQINPGDLPENIKSLIESVNETYREAQFQISEAKSVAVERTSQLITSTAQAYSFLDTIHKGFIMCDTSGEIVLTNDSLQKIITDSGLQITNEDISMANLDKLFAPSIEFRYLVALCGNTKQPQERNNVILGNLFLHLYIAPLLSENELLGVVVLIDDITEQKMLDRSKDEFLSIASHELRTPLTAIRGNTALIKKYYRPSLTRDVAQMIDDIHTSCVRLIGIVNDFLDATAMEQAKVKMQIVNFDPKPVIAEVIKELAELVNSKGIKLYADESITGTPMVYADRERTKQVLINLVGNAFKFTDAGFISISARIDDDFVNFSITDSGTGMNEDNQKLLFKKFQQAGSNLLTRAPTKGTGLGLYISKLIVELSGGKIWLEKSALNQGSTFTFSLPRSKNNN